jgi:hypothetical protein
MSRRWLAETLTVKFGFEAYALLVEWRSRPEKVFARQTK